MHFTEEIVGGINLPSTVAPRRKYAYTTGDLGTPIDTVLYTYGDDSWGDLLTAYDGVSRTYDEIGNVLSDGTWTYTWQNGRELASVSNGSATWSFTYDANGMRTSRTNGSYTYRYVYNGGQLMQLIMGGHTLNFAYDAAGTPMTVTFDGTMYYYITNLQGDVMDIADSSGIIVVSYAYDAWGKLLSTTGSMTNTLGAVNPLRYRSYVYDYETGYYYLQSRYYDPQIGRFINADGLIATGQGLLGNNMFTYCNNNPLNYVDRAGENSEAIGEWFLTMWWISAADGLVPVGEVILVGGALVILLIGASSSNNHTANDSAVSPAPTYLPPTASYAPPPSTTYGRSLLQAEMFAIRREEATAKTEIAVAHNKAQYYAAELVSGQVVPYMPLSYSLAKLHALAGGDILCVNHSAAYALVKGIPSARWDARHGSAESQCH